jgi:hypothetical protein
MFPHFDELRSLLVNICQNVRPNVIKKCDQMRTKWKPHCQNVGTNENRMKTTLSKCGSKWEWNEYCIILFPYSLPDRQSQQGQNDVRKSTYDNRMPSIFVALPTVQPKTSQLESPCKIRGWSLILKVFYIVQFSSTHHNLHSINLWKQAAFYMSKVIGWNITW